MAAAMTEKIKTTMDLHWFEQVHRNLPVAALVEHALARGEGRLAANGALVATTGKWTGRSPSDKYIVRNSASADTVDWGPINQPIEPERYAALRERVLMYARNRQVYALDTFAGAEPASRLPIRVLAEYAWHSLFAKQLFIEASADQLSDHVPHFTVLSMPGFRADPQRDGTRSKTAIVVDFERREVLIAGTEYAGEIKKSIFTVMNFLLPMQGILPMHCSANVGDEGDVALFFGLSGTGKTSLSSDPERRLIGDDEHGWGDQGIFNFEGGCYAKCIRLRHAAEPQIFDAIRFGAVLENVVLDDQRQPRYDDDSITENTRAAYPLDFIANTVQGGRGGHARTIFFLTADAFGVLPPIARLSPEQAMYYFLSGYTAKLAGTEVGLGSEPRATFEACFGSPFLPLPARHYARMLRDKIHQHNTRVYLLNTGWSGGAYGVGSRISIDHTRAMVRAALHRDLDTSPLRHEPLFGLDVPVRVDNVPDKLMTPRDTWQDGEAYDRAARQLAELFVANFSRFGLDRSEVAQAGPRL
jgi:phosphoenolpyruvate carboxykinase (ATP)